MTIALPPAVSLKPVEVQRYVRYVGHGKCSGVCEFASVLKAQADDVTTPCHHIVQHAAIQKSRVGG